MRILLFVLALFCGLETFAQYELLTDPRSGKPVRYAGDLAAKPDVVVPKYYRPGKKEFRGVWVATVENIDFPVSGSVAEFKKNYLAVVNNLKAIGANAIIFQVRPMNDAFYPSALNPWSRSLAGAEGRGLSGFDPLAFMIQEAHRRGLAFHAWLNPYRVAGGTALGKEAYLRTLAPNNFARRNPGLVLCIRRKDGKNQLILDPGNPATIRFLCNTVHELIMKYDVDGIHMDDYFYPYDGTGTQDHLTYRKYNRNRLGLEDWRRENVNTLIGSLSNVIRSYNMRYRKRVQFGISPFGIWANRKTHPAGSLTKGSESYALQHADTRKWVLENWIDYIVPQIYWTFGHNAAAYAALADWWAATARGSRTRLYIGHAPSRLGTSSEWSNPNEIFNQFRYNSRRPEIGGSVLFSYRSMFSPSNKVMKQGAAKIIQTWKQAGQERSRK